MKSSENTTFVVGFVAGAGCAAPGADVPRTMAAAPTAATIDLNQWRIFASHGRSFSLTASCHREKRQVNIFSKICLLVEILSDIRIETPVAAPVDARSE